MQVSISFSIYFHPRLFIFFFYHSFEFPNLKLCLLTPYLLTCTIWSKIVMFLFSFLVATRLMGEVLSNNEYFCFQLPITRSTFIRTLATLLVFSTSCCLNCFWPLVKAGIASWAPYVPSVSDILNPRSAMITSSYFSRNLNVLLNTGHWCDHTIL